MFAGRVMDVELGSADQLQSVVELLRLGRMADVAGVDHERGLVRHRQDLVDRRVERGARVRVRRLRKADMAVGNLDEGKAAFRRFGRADEARGGHAARDRPDDARPGPQHALQGLAAAEAAVVLVSHHVSPLFGESRRSRRRLGGGAVYSREVEEFLFGNKSRATASAGRGAPGFSAWAENALVRSSRGPHPGFPGHA